MSAPLVDSHRKDTEPAPQSAILERHVNAEKGETRPTTANDPIFVALQANNPPTILLVVERKT